MTPEREPAAAPAASGVEPAASSLRYHEVLRVAWLITWRQMVIVILASVLVMPIVGLALVGTLTTIGVPGSAVNSIVSFVPTLVLPALLQPILFLMAVNKEYRGFRIEALREDGHHEDLTLQESIAPSLILWIGGTLLVVALIVPIQFAMASILGVQFQNMLVPALFQVLFAYPAALWLLFRFHRARFHSFRLHVAREAV